MAEKPKIAPGTDWVGSIINAASYAVRADTLDSMLNQLPGEITKNQQMNAQRKFEIEKHNDAVDLEKEKEANNQAYRNTTLDFQLIGAMNDPSLSAEARMQAFRAAQRSGALKTPEGVASLEAFIKKDETIIAEKTSFNERFQGVVESKDSGWKWDKNVTDLNVEAPWKVKDYTSEDYLKDLNQLHIEALGNPNLSKYVPSLSAKITKETDNIANQFYADIADDLIFDESVSPEQQLAIKNTLAKATTAAQANFALKWMLEDGKGTVSVGDKTNLLGKVNDIAGLYEDTTGEIPTGIKNTQAWLMSELASDVGMGTADRTGILVKMEDGVLAMLYPDNSVQKIDSDYNPIGELYTAPPEQADSLRITAGLGTL